MFVVAGCARKPESAVARLAILPANVLIADPASEWMSVGAALALEEDLSTSSRVSAAVALDGSVAFQRGAARVLRTTIDLYGGRYRLRAVVTDNATQGDLQVVTASSAASGGLIAAVDELARELDPRATRYATRSDSALRMFAAAVEAPNAQSRLQALSQAIAIDPAFGLAYVAAIQTSEQVGATDAAGIVSQARPHEQSFTQVDRLRFDALAARIARAPLAQQAGAAEAALQVAPNDADLLATLAADRFLQADAERGRALINRALELNPDNASLRLELAQGLLENRRFAEAEKILTGFDNNPAILPELAVCILLEGDKTRADTVFANYLRARAAANDDSLFLAEANWRAISVSPTAALDYLHWNNLRQDDYKSLGASQVAVWQVMTGRKADAKQTAAAAIQFARSPTAKLLAEAATLIAASDEPADQWRAGVNAAPVDAGVKDAVLGYGLYLNGSMPEAVDQWRRLVQESGNVDLRARAMLAASLVGARREAEARGVGVQPFVPNITGLDLFAALSFEQMRRLAGSQSSR